MKRKTYNNVLKAIKLIEKKGYDFEEASKIALKIFDEHENDVMSIEWYINKIVSKDEYEGA
jgi:hypothetical protein